MRRSIGWIAVLALLVAPLGLAPSAAEPLVILATPVPLDVHGGRDRTGRLVYRGGLELKSPDGRFGGLSDLSVDPEGRKLLAISDRGHWVEAELRYDERGYLAGLADARIGPLISQSGRRLRGLAGDAESLAIYPDGSILVGFERQHRLWLYPAADPPFVRPPRPVPLPPRGARMPENGGIEALVRLTGGRLFALSEDLMEGGGHVGWFGDGVTWEELRYRAAPDFKPTGAAQFPPGTARAGDVLILERRFTILDGVGARIAAVPRNAIRGGAALRPEELAVLRQPLAVDNFEGIAIARGPAGEARVYLLSDDNFSFLQRTLLLMFEIEDG